VRFVRKHQLVHADKKAPIRPPASYLVYLTTTFKGAPLDSNANSWSNENHTS